MKYDVVTHGSTCRSTESENAIVHHGQLDTDVHLIGKPFTFGSSERVRSALDESS